MPSDNVYVWAACVGLPARFGRAWLGPFRVLYAERRFDEPDVLYLHDVTGAVLLAPDNVCRRSKPVNPRSFFSA